MNSGFDTTQDMRISVINSSASDIPFADVLNYVPSFVTGIDVYILRNIDAMTLYGEASVEDVAHYVAGMGRREIASFVGGVKSSILECDKIRNLQEQEFPKTEVTALATYFPQISNPGEEKTVVKALKKCTDIAHRLGCRCVEIVCGTIVDSEMEKVTETQEDGSKETKKIRVYCIGERRSKIQKLLDLLEELCDDAIKRDICFSLEIEPGPFHILNSGEALKTLFSELDKRDREFQEHVGVNLDIGHALMIEMDYPEIYPLLRNHENRIVHAHISDNAFVHFADLVPGAFHSIQPGSEFDRWINLWRSIAQASPGFEQHKYFTNTIALELECAPTIEWVIDGCYRILQMLTQRTRVA